jgi:hypothetical protein
MLLRLARSVVAHHLGRPVDATMPALSRALLQRNERIFVEFWVDGRMRGCRGAAGDTIPSNTLAATRQTLADPRVYGYDPAKMEWAADDHVVRQVAATWTLADLSRRYRTARHQDALARALAFIAARTRPNPAGGRGLGRAGRARAARKRRVRNPHALVGAR